MVSSGEGLGKSATGMLLPSLRFEEFLHTDVAVWAEKSASFCIIEVALQGGFLNTPT